MSKKTVPLAVTDTSSFAKSVLKQHRNSGAELSQTRLLNYISKASGFQNWQAYKAAHETDSFKKKALVEISFKPSHIRLMEPSNVLRRDVGHSRMEKLNKYCYLPIHIKTTTSKASIKPILLISIGDLPNRDENTPQLHVANALFNYFNSSTGLETLSKLNMCKSEYFYINASDRENDVLTEVTEDTNFFFTVTVPHATVNHLNKQIHKVTSASKALRYALERIDTLIRQNAWGYVEDEEREKIYSWLNYINESTSAVTISPEDGLRCHETTVFEGFASVARRIADNKPIDDRALSFAYTDLHKFHFPRNIIWIHEPPPLASIKGYVPGN